MRLSHAIMALAPALLLAGCAGPSPAPTPTTSQPAPATSAVAPPTNSAPAGQGKTCLYPTSGSAAKPNKPPAGKNVPTSGTVTFKMSMTAGDVVLQLDRASAPCAVASFESLVSQQYYDNTDCHRLAPGFVLQCGDPTGSGSGGPGYRYADELKGTETYPRGTVAMANAGPNTNGSQFFIALADIPLPAQYDVLGQVTADSMAVIDAIAAKGVTNPSDPKCITPAWGNHINSVTAA